MKPNKGNQEFLTGRLDLFDMVGHWGSNSKKKVCEKSFKIKYKNLITFCIPEKGHFNFDMNQIKLVASFQYYVKIGKKLAKQLRLGNNSRCVGLSGEDLGDLIHSIILSDISKRELNINHLSDYVSKLVENASEKLNKCFNLNLNNNFKFVFF